MDKLILLWLLILLTGSCSPVNQMRQKTEASKRNIVKKRIVDTALFKGANKIVIENDFTPNQNLFLLQTELVKKGYKVRINRKMRSISTADSIIESGKVAYVFNGLVDSNRIELSGKYHIINVTSLMGESSHVFKYDINFSGWRNGLPKKMFSRLMEVADHVQGRKTFIDETKKKRGSLL